MDLHEDPLIAIIELFPDISPAYAQQLLEEKGFDTPAIIQHILDEEENGKHYERLPAFRNIKKRKREVEEAEKQNDAALAAKQRFTSDEHKAKHKAVNYITMS